MAVKVPYVSAYSITEWLPWISCMSPKLLQRETGEILSEDNAFCNNHLDINQSNGEYHNAA